MDTYEDDVEWFTKTIIPGVKDGVKALGRTDEPPILLRAHDTDCKMVMDAALPLYKNLMCYKYWQISRRNFGTLGDLADFGTEGGECMHKCAGANALHLYPQASYWELRRTRRTNWRMATREVSAGFRDWIWYKT